MIAELEYPIKSLKGNIGHEFYTRTLNGKQVIQRRPKRDKPPTEAQIKVRKSFAEKYAGEAFFVKLVENHVHLLKIQRTSVASASGGNKIRVFAVRFIKIS